MHHHHNNVNIVVFPEYSFPAEEALERFQQKANSYGQIIVAGADTFFHRDDNKFYNQSPIIVPNEKEPFWLTKRFLAQWEQGYVDEPDNVSIPILTWKAGRRKYRLRACICIDYLRLIEEPESYKKGPQVFVVPMCSPHMLTFRTYADALLRTEGGTATILCNCVGGNAAGQSAVIAVVPGGQPLQPALELTNSKEQVGVFEIDCNSLSPPKKTPVRKKWPVGKRYKYLLNTSPEATTLVVSDIEESAGESRGVINPAILDLFNKKMRIAFLRVEKLPGLVEKLKDQDFEVLGLLGRDDLMVTHINSDLYEMIYDVDKVIPLKKPLIRTTPESTKAINHTVTETFRHFAVDVFYKVLGVPIGPEERTTFDALENPVPSPDDLNEILALGKNWEEETITEDTRKRFLERKWILSTSRKGEERIDAIMTIFLDFAGADIAEPFELFEAQVLPELIARSEITSVYGGGGRRLPVDYILRITGSASSVFDLVTDLHHLADEARIVINTSTYIVMKKFAGVSFENACLLPVLPGEEQHYRDRRFLPRLSEEDRLRFIYYPKNKQRKLLQQYKDVEVAISLLHGCSWIRNRVAEMERNVAAALVHLDFSSLKQPHDTLQAKVENFLKETIAAQITEEAFEKWREALNIPKGKTKDGLTYGEEIKLVTRGIQEGKIDSYLSEHVKSLPPTVKTRNAFAHAEWDKLTIETCVEALVTYCAFLSNWAPASSS